MVASARIDTLDPKGTHIPLLVAAVSVRVLKRFLHSLPCNPYTILRPSPKTLSQLQHLLLVHLDQEFFSFSLRYRNLKGLALDLVPILVRCRRDGFLGTYQGLWVWVPNLVNGLSQWTSSYGLILFYESDKRWNKFKNEWESKRKGWIMHGHGGASFLK